MMICTVCHKTFTGKYVPEGPYPCPDCYKNVERERGMAYMQFLQNWEIRLPDCVRNEFHLQKTLHRMWKADGFGEQVRGAPTPRKKKSRKTARTKDKKGAALQQ